MWIVSIHVIVSPAGVTDSATGFVGRELVGVERPAAILAALL